MRNTYFEHCLQGQARHPALDTINTKCYTCCTDNIKCKTIKKVGPFKTQRDKPNSLYILAVLSLSALYIFTCTFWEKNNKRKENLNSSRKEKTTKGKTERRKLNQEEKYRASFLAESHIDEKSTSGGQEDTTPNGTKTC